MSVKDDLKKENSFIPLVQFYPIQGVVCGSTRSATTVSPPFTCCDFLQENIQI